MPQNISTGRYGCHSDFTMPCYPLCCHPSTVGEEMGVLSATHAQNRTKTSKIRHRRRRNGRFVGVAGSAKTAAKAEVSIAEVELDAAEVETAGTADAANEE